LEQHLYELQHPHSTTHHPHHYPEEPNLTGKDIDNVIRGYKVRCVPRKTHPFKAAAHNPHNSEEARLHAMEMVRKLEAQKSEGGQEDLDVDLAGKNIGNVIGGYKVRLRFSVHLILQAAAHNPNVSLEAKMHAQHVVDVLEHKQGK
jgi:hypothetical protein